MKQNKSKQNFSSITGRNVRKTVIALFSIIICGMAVYIPFTADRSGIGNRKSDAATYYDSVFAKGASLFYKNTDTARTYMLGQYQSIPEKNVYQKMRFLNFIGATYQVQDNYSQAMEYYYQALKLAPESIDSSLLVAIYNNIGYINQKTGNYKMALNFMLKAKNQCREDNMTSSILNNIGIVYLSIGEYDKGETYFREALNSSGKSKDSISMATLLANIGFVLIDKEQSDSAQACFFRSLMIAERIEYNYAIILACNGLGDLFTKTEKLTKAERYHNKARQLAGETNDSYNIAYAVMGLARVEYQKGNTSEALKLNHEASEIADRIGNDMLLYESKKLSSEILEKEGEYEESLKYLREYINLRDKFVNQSSIRQVYNEEITVLNEANKIKQLEIERKELQLSRKNIMVIAVSIVGFLGILGLFFMFRYYKSRQNSKMQGLIIEMNERKSRTVIETEIRERKRVGQELHDGLGQMLSVARLNVSALNPKNIVTKERMQQLVNSALNSIDNAFIELRHISQNLSPTILSTKGLEEAIEEIAKRVNESNKIQTSYEIFGLDNQMDPLVENALYRAVQELINNVIKHAYATKLSVQLVQNEEDIMLILEDNGIGFKAESKIIDMKGSGLHNIKSRIENLHGTIFIDSKKNRGTIISINIPLKSNGYGTIKN